MLTSNLKLPFAEFIKNARQSLFVIAPYVHADAFDAIVAGANVENTVIITTWTTRDVLTGMSDISLFPRVSACGWSLRLHQTLHAKLLVADLERAIVSSANVTGSALSLTQPPNVECAVTVEALSHDDRIWVLRLIQESFPVDDVLWRVS